MSELDFVGKLSHPAIWPRVCESLANTPDSGPVVVEFDPTSACNFSCPECVSMGLLNRGSMETERALELISELAEVGVKGIIFIGGGEPLAHASIDAIIHHAHDCGLRVGLVTNGSLLDKHMETVAECASWTRVSMDAARSTTFSSVRPTEIHACFDKIVSAMSRLARRKLGTLGFSFLLVDRTTTKSELVSNLLEIHEAACMAKEIGCDYFELKPVVDAHHQLVPLGPRQREVVREQANRVATLVDDTFRFIYPDSLSIVLSDGGLAQPKSYRRCPTLALRTVCSRDGLYPCPYKRGSSRHRRDLSQAGFAAFWRSPMRRAWNLEIDPSVDCKHFCNRHSLNEWLLQPRGTLPHQGVGIEGTLENSPDPFI